MFACPLVPWCLGRAVVPFGMVALEATAGGTLVVAYDVGILPRLIGDAELIVPQAKGPLDGGAQYKCSVGDRYATAQHHGPDTTDHGTMGPPLSHTNC